MWTCYGYVSGYLTKVREHIQSHHKKSSREWSCSSHKKGDSRKSDSSLDGMSSDEEWSAGELEEEDDDDNNKESGSSSDEISPDTSDLKQGSYLSILIIRTDISLPSHKSWCWLPRDSMVWSH